LAVDYVATHTKNDLAMKIGMVIYSNDAETVWNAFRFGNFALGEEIR